MPGFENFADSESQAGLPTPEFGYDKARAEASLLLEDGLAFKLKNVMVYEPNSTLSILKGEGDDGAVIEIEVMEANQGLEVVKVTVDGESIYPKTLH